MADKFTTGIDLPNLESGSARASSPGFIRLFARNDFLYGMLPDNTERQLAAVVRERYFSSGNSTPVDLAETVIEYHGKLETGGPGATFHVTTDGTSSGDPLFDNLEDCGLYPSADKPTGENDESPWVHIREVINGGRSVLVQVKRSNTGGMLVGGVYRGNLNNDGSVTVRLHVIGPKNPNL